MILKIENPGALAGAAGTKFESGSMTPYITSAPRAATLSRLRSAHVAALCGVTDHRAAMIVAVYFAEVAS